LELFCRCFSSFGKKLIVDNFFGLKQLVLLIFLCGIGAPLSAQEQVNTLSAYRLSDSDRVQLDGRMNESFWSKAEVTTGFRQREPVEGAEPSEKTEVRVGYDNNTLFIGAMLFDSEPDGIIGFQKERDAFLFTDDRFMIVLDTFKDGRTGYLFEVNPAGLMGDGLIGAGSRFGVNKDWDGIWEARVQKVSNGWTVEIAIPFGTLNFDPDSDGTDTNAIKASSNPSTPDY